MKSDNHKFLEVIAIPEGESFSRNVF